MDPVEAYYLQIQGSGQLEMLDGRRYRAAYAGNNGYKGVLIGSYLLNKGIIKKSQASLTGIKTWLRNNPRKADQAFRKNDRYIFFKLERTGSDGPKGAEGVPLTAERSLAVDPQYIPYGTMMWLDIPHPRKRQKIQKLMVAQDTGSAIKGPIRADFFWGAGTSAGHNAGSMKSRGEWYMIVPRG